MIRRADARSEDLRGWGGCRDAPARGAAWSAWVGRSDGRWGVEMGGESLSRDLVCDGRERKDTEKERKSCSSLRSFDPLLSSTKACFNPY
ncbi:hypothetical protein Cni_G20451 [Canna indica]|uniref:Uncharacterized protein n=1 Tax=Canna indica TaxID=4628 RepID=A0AAQ3KTU5_9LILI|nr:hypothetical protein Cni_G20451 [Canna indica]